MTDRLAELVRQRALVQEHLAWLDRQIVDATRKPPTTATEASVATPVVAAAAVESVADRANPSSIIGVATASTASASQTSPLASNNDADEILEQFRVPSDAVRNDVRKGCFLYFAAAFLLLGLGVAILYFVFRPR